MNAALNPVAPAATPFDTTAARGATPTRAAERTAHEQIGFELGWDYAHYRMEPAPAYLIEASPLRDGLAAGRAVFGQRTLLATRSARKWLQLRLNAWLRGRSVELMQVTPSYLQQIEVEHCPITRVALSTATLDATDASVDRVRNDAGYAAGNLAVMSARANRAKGALGMREAQEMARRVDADGLGGISELDAAQWARVAALCSYVEPMPHDVACALPLLVMPPNRLRLFNPVQALQAVVSQQLLTPGWSARIGRIEGLIPGKPVRRAFQAFFHALLPRVLEARADGPLATRWAIEDAWRNALVQRRWSDFARQLSAAECETLLLRVQRRRLCGQRIDAVGDALATEGWNLETRGYVPHAAAFDGATAAPRQASLAL